MSIRSANSVFIFVLVSSPFLLAGDITVKTIQHTSATTIILGNPPPPEVTIYVHGMTQRVELVGSTGPAGSRTQPAPHKAIITHCDTGVVYQLDLNRQEYAVSKLDKFPSQDQFAKQMAREQKEDQKHSQSSTVDTGETKDFYGYVAKHIVTTIKGKDKDSDYEEVVDGWYLDLLQPGCTPEYLRQHQGHVETTDLWNVRSGSPLYDQFPQLAPSPGSGPQLSTVHTGIQSALVYNWFLPGGLVVQQTSTSHQTLTINGHKRPNEVRTEQKIVEFSETPLDPSLFEVPQGFKKVRDLYQHK